MCSIGDASFANETKGDDSSYSQQGVITVLAPTSVLNGEQFYVHFISWYRTIIKRVRRATIQAEGYAMTGAVERGSRQRSPHS